MGYNPQESLENTINTMGTLLGVHPIVPWYKMVSPGRLLSMKGVKCGAENKWTKINGVSLGLLDPYI